MTGLLWYDATPDKTLEQKVREAADRFAEKNGKAPERAQVNRLDLNGTMTVYLRDGGQISVATGPVPHHHILIGCEQGA